MGTAVGLKARPLRARRSAVSVERGGRASKKSRTQTHRLRVVDRWGAARAASRRQRAGGARESPRGAARYARPPRRAFAGRIARRRRTGRDGPSRRRRPRRRHLDFRPFSDRRSPYFTEQWHCEAESSGHRQMASVLRKEARLKSRRHANSPLTRLPRVAAAESQETRRSRQCSGRALFQQNPGPAAASDNDARRGAGPGKRQEKRLRTRRASQGPPPMKTTASAATD